MDTVKDAVSRLFMVRMKLGEFDPPEMNPYTKSVIANDLGSLIKSGLQYEADVQLKIFVTWQPTMWFIV